MDKICRAMMNLIGSEICGNAVCADEIKALSDDELKALYKLSKSHDLAHLVGNALIKNNLLDEENPNGDENHDGDKTQGGGENHSGVIRSEIKQKFEKQILTAIYRYENINSELETLKTAFEEERIPFIPLKGSVIRQYYPEPWLRTSCDIDILVHEEDIERAIAVLTDKNGYTLKDKGYHDYSLFSPAGVHLELHFNIKENMNTIDGVLIKAWDYAEVCDGKTYEHKFSDEFLMYHQFAHASYHFVNGGCGIRPIIDIFLLRKAIPYDKKKAGELLDEGKIKTFADKICNLSEVWFGGAEHNETTKNIEKFLLSGGIYGTKENYTAVGQSKNKGKAGHLLKRIWLPYQNLAIEYPNLKGKRILQPFYEIKRWCKLFKKDIFKKSMMELKTNTSMSQEKVDETKAMLKDLGLSD